MKWRGVPWLLGVSVFVLVVSTAPHYGVTWDEPPYFRASDLHVQWLVDLGKNLFNGQARESLQEKAIKAAWRSDPYYVPHPPFSRILSGITKALFSPIAHQLTAYRLAPALLFSLLVVLMYVWMSALFDWKTGLFSAIALVLIPNLFGFAHFAVTDLPLATMWFLTVYCFWRGLVSWKWSVFLGVVWGLALSTKFPALLIPIPLLLWAHLYHRRSYQNNVFSMIFISPLVMLASQPHLWKQPFMGVLTFLYEGVSRGYRPDTSYPIFFYNQLLFSNELPRYYSFFIIAVTTPETILVLFLIGAASIFFLKTQQDVLVLLLLNAIFIPFLGLLPGAVLHDGARQFLSALPFLAALAGAGCFFLVQWLTRWMHEHSSLQRIRFLSPKLLAVISLLALFPPLIDVWTYHPYQLSYYNRLIGGLPGAYRHGLEVTYFMEALTPDLLRHFNEKLPSQAVVNASFANFMLEYYQNGNGLRPDIRITYKDDFDYYILLNRKSAFGEKDWAFVATKPYIFDALRLDGVPLVLVLKPRG